MSNEHSYERLCDYYKAKQNKDMIAELMLGNYVSITPHEETDILELDISCFESLLMFKNFERIKPIKLTEYWADKLGFSNYNSELSNCDLWNQWYIGDFLITFEGDHFLYNETKIETVHHLQNLYHSIELKKLKIKNNEKAEAPDRIQERG